MIIPASIDTDRIEDYTDEEILEAYRLLDGEHGESDNSYGRACLDILRGRTVLPSD